MTHQGLIIETKHVIYFNYSSLDCAAQNLCNMLLLETEIALEIVRAIVNV